MNFDRFIFPGRQFKPVQIEKDFHARKGNSFVAIDEPMVHRQAFPECCSLFEEVGIVACLRPQQCRLNQTTIPDPGSASMRLQERIVNVYGFLKCNVPHYFAKAS